MYKKGDIIVGKVVSIVNFGALIELEDERIGLLHISKISDYFIADLNKFLTLDEYIRVRVLNCDDKRVELTIKDVPHYRNLGSAYAEDFEVLARKLPQWIKTSRKPKMKQKLKGEQTNGSKTEH